jgi:hypothetical protein
MDLQRQIESLREQIQPILAERAAAAQQAQRLEKSRPASLAVVR